MQREPGEQHTHLGSGKRGLGLDNMESPAIPILPDDAALALACGLHPRLGVDSPVAPSPGKPFAAPLRTRGIDAQPSTDGLALRAHRRNQQRVPSWVFPVERFRSRREAERAPVAGESGLGFMEVPSSSEVQQGILVARSPV